MTQVVLFIVTLDQNKWNKIGKFFGINVPDGFKYIQINHNNDILLWTIQIYFLKINNLSKSYNDNE